MARKPKIVTVGGDVVAKALGVSRMQVNNWVNDGTLAKVARGQYDLVDCLTRMVRYYRERMNASSDSLAADRAREQRARANIAERDDLVAAGKFVPVEACQTCWDAAVTELREGVDASRLFSTEQKQELTRIAQGIKLDALDPL